MVRIDVQAPGKVKRVLQVCMTFVFQQFNNLQLLKAGAVFQSPLHTDSVDGVLPGAPSYFCSLQRPVFAVKTFSG